MLTRQLYNLLTSETPHRPTLVLGNLPSIVPLTSIADTGMKCEHGQQWKMWLYSTALQIRASVLVSQETDKGF